MFVLVFACLRHEHCLDYIYSNFSKQEVLRRRAALVAQVRVNVHETMGRKDNCKLNFFSMYFGRNNEETHFSFKNSEK